MRWKRSTDSRRWQTTNPAGPDRTLDRLSTFAMAAGPFGKRFATGGSLISRPSAGKTRLEGMETSQTRSHDENPSHHDSCMSARQYERLAWSRSLNVSTRNVRFLPCDILARIVTMGGSPMGRPPTNRSSPIGFQQNGGQDGVEGAKPYTTTAPSPPPKKGTSK